MQEKLNILIVCEHATNKFGGEAMLPLNYFRLLSQQSETVYLITHERVRKSLETIEELNHQNIYYIPDTKLHKLLHKCSSYLPHRISVITFGSVMHFLTQYYQRKLAKQVIKNKAIDVVHEPAPVSPILPSAMFGLNTPVIIGPMNGGMSFPEAFSYMAGRSEKVLFKLVRAVAPVINFLLPGKRNADLLLVANQRTADALPKFIGANVAELVENGVFSHRDKPIERATSEEINVIYVGRLVDWKRVDIAIDAVAKTDCKANLIIVGDGAERSQLEEKVKTENIKNITFVGMVSHKEINSYYDNADIFILPSVRECGGAVVLEAMARGLPVLATDWGGPADYVAPTTGYLVKPHSKQYMIDEFSRLIDELSANPKLRQDVGVAAIKHIKSHFLWDEKIKTITQYYENVIEQYSSKTRQK